MTGDDHDIDEQAETRGAMPEIDPEAVAEVGDTVHAQSEEQPQPDPGPALGDLDTGDAASAPEDEVAASLRTALGEMRGEADRIATLGTGQEQVEAAERFAEDAGRLDEQIGSSARAADDDER